MKKYTSLFKLYFKRVINKTWCLLLVVGVLQAVLAALMVGDSSQTVSLRESFDNVVMVIPFYLGLVMLTTYILTFNMNNRAYLTLRRINVSCGFQACMFGVVSFICIMLYMLVSFGVIVGISYAKNAEIASFFSNQVRVVRIIIYIVFSSVASGIGFYENVNAVRRKTDIMQCGLILLSFFNPPTSDLILILVFLTIVLFIFYCLYAIKNADGEHGEIADQLSHKSFYIAKGIMNNAYEDERK